MSSRYVCVYTPAPVCVSLPVSLYITKHNFIAQITQPKLPEIHAILHILIPFSFDYCVRGFVPVRGRRVEIFGWANAAGTERH